MARQTLAFVLVVLAGIAVVLPSQSRAAVASYCLEATVVGPVPDTTPCVSFYDDADAVAQGGAANSVVAEFSLTPGSSAEYLAGFFLNSSVALDVMDVIHLDISDATPDVRAPSDVITPFGLFDFELRFDPLELKAGESVKLNFLNATLLSNFTSSLSSGPDDLRLFGAAIGQSVGLSWNTFSPSTVPEPATLALVALGLCGVACLQRRRLLTNSPA